MNFCGTQDRRRGDRLPTRASRTGISWLVGLVALSQLGGCASTDSIGRSQVRNAAPAEQAFVFPPIGGPAIVGVIEGKRGGRTYQEILLNTNSSVPGQNRFEVSIARNAAPVVDPYPRIFAEARSALPGVRMSRSPYYVQNRYGPFGYSIGRGTSKDLCLFGWQTIRTKASPMTKQGAIDIRLRLCETGATERKLLSVMYGYTVNAFLNSQQWNPYGDPLPPDPELGRRGRDIYPFADQAPTETLPAAPRAQAQRQPGTAVIVPEKPVQTTPVAGPSPSGPQVPLPPGSVEQGSSEAAPTAPLVPPPPSEE
ncbi:MAG: cellulose biosynthesis protein BcsN [Rhizobiaceae bacterium]|nr:cellulose biosynthesis protein BcsN [Rhizobiaceae bacterium]